MKQLLCYGDSNTWGYDPNTKSRYPWGVRWTGILQKKLQTFDVRVLEEGLCGRTAAWEDRTRENRNGLKTLPLILESHAPLDGAILMLGTNDCKACYGMNEDEITAGIEKCVDKLLSVISADHILLVSPIHLGKKVWMPGYDTEFNRYSVSVAEKLEGKYKGLALRKGLRVLAASDYAGPDNADQEHLSPAGHAALAEAFFNNLLESPILK